MKTFSNIFRSTLCWGGLIFEYILYPIYFLLLPTSFIYNIVSSLLSPLNDVLSMLLMRRVILSFLLSLSSHHPYTFISPLQQTLKQNRRASPNCTVLKYFHGNIKTKGITKAETSFLKLNGFY